MARKGALAERAAELEAAVAGLFTGTPVTPAPVKKKAKKKPKNKLGLPARNRRSNRLADRPP